MLRCLGIPFLALGLAAQTPPCIALNDGTTSVGTSLTAVGFGGPAVRAYQFSPATFVLLQAAQIFTASTPATPARGYQTLEIWDTNLLGLPQARLGGGTWQNQPTAPLAPAWQGASFDAAVPCSPGVIYWLVWREGGANLLPTEPGGVQAVHARFVGGTWALQAAGQAIKWRGFCNLLDGQGVAPQGNGCSSSSGAVPSLFTNQAPTLGNADFQFEATGLPPGSIGLAILGSNPTWSPVAIPGAPVGCLLRADPQAVATVAVGTGNEQVAHSIGAAGHAWVDLALPPTPGLAGVVLDAQFAALDLASGAPLPFVFTNGLRVTLF